MKNKSPISLFVASEKALNGNSYSSLLRGSMYLSAELESGPKSSRSRRDFDTTTPRLGAKSRDETETRHETIEIRGSRKIVNILIVNI